ncbi:MAG: hypothetical protein JW966_15535 [Anaerolineae bacterium]|nr:hypothetical protein [Anaerolineae bacterium]
MMGSISSSKNQYGLSTDLYVSREDGDQTLLLGGVGQGARQWTQVMTQRAAQQLWYKLTALLYPEKSDAVIGLAVTAPLRSPENALVTTYMDVVKNGESQYTVMGWIQRETWMVLLSEDETRRLWGELDLELYPVGWEGRSIHPKKLN